MTERERIGKRIAELREAHNVSQKGLAEAIGTHQGNIARLEAGKYNAGFDTLQAIASFFEMQIDFI